MKSTGEQLLNHVRALLYVACMSRTVWVRRVRKCVWGAIETSKKEAVFIYYWFLLFHFICSPFFLLFLARCFLVHSSLLNFYGCFFARFFFFASEKDLRLSLSTTHVWWSTKWRNKMANQTIIRLTPFRKFYFLLLNGRSFIAFRPLLFANKWFISSTSSSMLSLSLSPLQPQFIAQHLPATDIQFSRLLSPPWFV